MQLLLHFEGFRLVLSKMCVAAASLLKRPRTPPGNNSALDYQSADSEHIMKRVRSGGQAVDEVLFFSSIFVLE